MTTLDEVYARYKKAAGTLTPEEACKDAPDLLPVLLQRLAEEHAAHLPAVSQATADFSPLYPMTPTPQVAAGTNPSTPTPSPTIPGYKVGKEIGKGGQGIVYEAIQENPKRKVAIKVLLNASHASSEAVYRFKREIDLVAGLRHPNIVAVFDTGTTSEGHPYYAMDFVRGIPLTTYVQEHKLSLEVTLKLFHVLCDTVNHAHQKGVIHRDLKPSNILVDDQGQLHILDFGLAKQIGESIDNRVSITGQIVGTLPYMAPEQTRGDPDILDVRTDVYALGVMLYELLTGAYPYPVVGAMAEVLGHIVHTAPKRLTQSWTRGRGVATRSRRRSSTCPIDHEIETIAFKALSKERERRYQSAGELGRDVQHYLNDEAIDAKRDSAMYLLSKAMKRYRAAAALIVGVFLLAVVSTIVFWKLRNEAVTAAAGERVARDAAQSAATQLEVERDKATASLHDAQERLVVASSYDGSYLALTGRPVEARQILADSLKLSPQTKMSPLWVALPLLDVNARFPPPLSPASFYQGHTDAVRAVAYTPDGRRCVSAGADKTLRVWDVRTGVLLMTLQGHSDFVYGVAISPDGNQALSGSEDRTLKLWDLRTGKEIQTFQGHANSVYGVAMSVDGKTAVSSGIDGEIITWDVASGRQIGRIKRNDRVHGVAISPDGKFGLAGEDAGTVVQWELSTGRVVRTLPSSGKPSLCVAYSPDGRWILSSGDAADKVKLWDAGTGALVRTFDGHKQPVFSLAFSPDGRKALSASSDRTIRLWDCATGQNIRTFFGHTGGVNSVAFSPDGLTAISGGEDSALKLWRIEEELPCTVFGGGATAGCVAVSPDNLLILSGSQNGLVTLWDAATCRELQRFDGHRQAVRCVAFAKDRLISAGEDRTIRFWNAVGGSNQPLAGQDCYAISPDGESALTADRRGVLSLLDLRSGKPTRTLRRDPATGKAALPTPPDSAVFSRDSARILTGMGDGDVDLWDAKTGASVKSWTTPYAGISALAFTADAESALSASLLDSRLTLWDLAKGESRLTMSGHSGMIFNIQSSADGRTALSGGKDGDLKVWDVQLGQEIGSASLRVKSTLLALALSEDGKSAVAGRDDKSLERWDFDRPLRLCELDQDMTDSSNGGAARSNMLLLLGEWYALRGMDAWAVDVLEEARKAGGKVPALMLGRLYWKLHRYGEARREFEAARADGKEPEAYVALCLSAIAREEKLPAATGP